MTPAHLLRMLGLPATATRQQIKRAYRRMALELHPDRNRGDESSRRRFVEISHAYRQLMQAARGREAGSLVGICRRCGQLGEVFRSLDGRGLCERCILGPVGAKLLPLPVMVVSKCFGTVTLLGAAIGFLIWGAARRDGELLALAFATGLASLVMLTLTCLSIRQCMDAREAAFYRRFGPRQ